MGSTVEFGELITWSAHGRHMAALVVGQDQGGETIRLGHGPFQWEYKAFSHKCEHGPDAVMIKRPDGTWSNPMAPHLFQTHQVHSAEAAE